MRARLAFVVLGLVAVAPLRATTVIAPTFKELVAEADLVFEGQVLETKARMDAREGGAVIVTDVSFRVLKRLKGTSGDVVSLEFLGGTVGDRRYRIDGMPTFTRGDHDVLFAVTSQRLISPLVGMMHGRVRVAHDGTAPHVRLFDGTPLRNVSVFGAKEPPARMSSEPAMSLTAFEAAVTSEIDRQSAEKRLRR